MTSYRGHHFNNLQKSCRNFSRQPDTTKRLRQPSSCYKTTAISATAPMSTYTFPPSKTVAHVGSYPMTWPCGHRAPPFLGRATWSLMRISVQQCYTVCTIRFRPWVALSDHQGTLANQRLDVGASSLFFCQALRVLPYKKLTLLSSLWYRQLSICCINSVQC